MFPLAQRPMKMIRDSVLDFDFGYHRGNWVGCSYIAEPVPGIGVVVFKPHTAANWCMAFFPVQPDTGANPLSAQYANYVVWKARSEEPVDRVPHYGNLDDVLTITSLINHHTIGEEHDRVSFRNLPPWIPHA